MDHVFIMEAAHYVADCVGLANVGKELVAQTLPFGGARHQAGDVDEFDNCRHDSLRPGNLGQLRQTRIRHLDDAGVRLDGAEGIVFRRDARLGQRVEQGGFSDVGQANDAAFETHGFSWSLMEPGLVLARWMAAFHSPFSMSGHKSSARSMAASMSACSSRRGGFRT